MCKKPRRGLSFGKQLEYHYYSGGSGALERRCEGQCPEAATIGTRSLGFNSVPENASNFRKYCRVGITHKKSDKEYNALLACNKLGRLVPMFILVVDMGYEIIVYLAWGMVPI